MGVFGCTEKDVIPTLPLKPGDFGAPIKKGPRYADFHGLGPGRGSRTRAHEKTHLPPPQNQQNTPIFKNPPVSAASHESHLFLCTKNRPFSGVPCGYYLQYSRFTLKIDLQKLIFTPPHSGHPHFAGSAVFGGFRRHFRADFPGTPPFQPVFHGGRGGSPAKPAQKNAGKGPPFAAFYFVAGVGFAPDPIAAFSMFRGF